MRVRNLFSAIGVLALWTLFTASCIQSAPVGPAAERTPDPAPGLATQDDSFGNEPDVAESPVGPVEDEPNSLRAEPEGRFTYTVCVLVRSGSKTARVAFCVSQPERDVRARCYAHLNDTPVSWANWCYEEFFDE